MITSTFADVVDLRTARAYRAWTEAGRRASRAEAAATEVVFRLRFASRAASRAQLLAELASWTAARIRRREAVGSLFGSTRR